MRYVRQFGRFWYEFVVGDDWQIAAAVVVLVIATVLLARRWNVWPLLPIGTALTLAHSLRRAARAARTPPRREA